MLDGATCCTVYVSNGSYVRTQICQPAKRRPVLVILRGQQNGKETWLVAQFKRAAVPSSEDSTWKEFMQLKQKVL